MIYHEDRSSFKQYVSPHLPTLRVSFGFNIFLITAKYRDIPMESALSLKNL